MESVAEQAMFRSVWRLTRHKAGTWYIHVPKEFASIAGFSDGDQVELSIWKIHRQPKKSGERKNA